MAKCAFLDVTRDGLKSNVHWFIVLRAPGRWARFRVATSLPKRKEGMFFLGGGSMLATKTSLLVIEQTLTKERYVN